MCWNKPGMLNMSCTPRPIKKRSIRLNLSLGILRCETEYYVLPSVLSCSTSTCTPTYILGYHCFPVADCVGDLRSCRVNFHLALLKVSFIDWAEKWKKERKKRGYACLKYQNIIWPLKMQINKTINLAFKKAFKD